jgi:hypothetical protein
MGSSQLEIAPIVFLLFRIIGVDLIVDYDWSRCPLWTASVACWAGPVQMASASLRDEIVIRTMGVIDRTCDSHGGRWRRRSSVVTMVVVDGGYPTTTDVNVEVVLVVVIATHGIRGEGYP